MCTCECEQTFHLWQFIIVIQRLNREMKKNQYFLILLEEYIYNLVEICASWLVPISLLIALLISKTPSPPLIHCQILALTLIEGMDQEFCQYNPMEFLSEDFVWGKERIPLSSMSSLFYSFQQPQKESEIQPKTSVSQEIDIKDMPPILKSHQPESYFFTGGM